MTETKMTHCPKCSKPVLNAGQFLGCAQFSIKCPWCQAVVTISVQQHISAKLKMQEPEPQPEFSSQANSDDMGFGAPMPQRQAASANNEDGFKVVGYIYPQGDKKSSG